MKLQSIYIEIIKDSGVSVEDFFEMIRKVIIAINKIITRLTYIEYLQKSQDDDEAQIFVQIMLSVSEYENFIGMMKSYKSSHPN